MAQQVENPPAKAGDAGLIPGSGRSPGAMATHSCILAWGIPWTEETGRLQSVGLQAVGLDWRDQTHMHACKHIHES